MIATPIVIRPADLDARLLTLLAGSSRCPLEQIRPDSDLALELGLDSLGRVELAARLAEELGIAVDDGALATASTVADLAALVAAAPRAEEAPRAEGQVAFPRWARRGAACCVRAALQRALLFPLVDRICTPLRIDGAEYLRTLAPPFLLVANHTSHLDTPLLLRSLPAYLRERLAVAAAADYFFDRRALGALVALLLGAFPLARHGAARASLVYCAELVEAGGLVLLYPEGGRAGDGRLQPFKAGVGLLAVELGVPVLPVYLAGPATCLPKGARWPRRGPATVQFGPPLRFGPGTSPLLAAGQVEAAVRRLGHASLAQPRAGDSLASVRARLGGQLQAIDPLHATEAAPPGQHQAPRRAMLYG